MRKLNILDVSNIAWMSLHSVSSGSGKGGAWTTPDIETEFAKRFALALYSSVIEHSTPVSEGKKSFTVFAMDKKKDGNYWRDAVVRKWNEKGITYSRLGELWVQHRNGLLYFEDGTKVTKKFIKESGNELEPVENADQVIPTKTMAKFLAMLDGYKGSRTRIAWKYDLPKERFAQIMGGTADFVASMLEGVAVVRVPGYEADDIVAALVHSKQLREQYDEIVMVTKDGDWHQLCTDERVRLFNLNSKDGKLIGFDPKDPEEAKKDLEKKIVLGDSGDSIPPTLTDDGVRITEGKYGVLVPSAVTLKRNTRLIRLDYDQWLLTAIFDYVKKIWTPVPNADWKSLRVAEVELENIKINSSLNAVFSAWNSGFVIPDKDQ